MYAEARETAGFTQKEAAKRLHIGLRTLRAYELGDVVPSPEMVLKMSRIYRQPELTMRYCRTVCAIGQAYSYEVLDAVDTGLAAVIMKLTAEIEEAREVLCRLLHMVPNKQAKTDFTETEWREFTQALQEFLDVEHTVEVLKGTLARLAGMEEIEAQIALHNHKCCERGYARKKKPLCAATGRV